MTQRLREKLDDLKQEEIIGMAGTLFYERGYTRTSMDDIASALGIGKPMIYGYFGSKTELLAAVCNRTTALVVDLASFALQAEGTAQHRLTSIIRQLCHKVIEGRRLLTVLFREVKHLPDYALTELAENEQRFRRVIIQLLQEGKATGEFHYQADERVIAHAISGMTTWIHTWYSNEGPLSPGEIAQDMIENVLSMVRCNGSAGLSHPQGSTSPTYSQAE